MVNFGKLLTLIRLVQVLSFVLTDGSDEDLSAEDCSVLVNLTAVGLKNLPNGIVKNKFITHLILDKNEIPAVRSEAFSSVPSLSHLSLAENKLTNLNLSPFSKLYNLKTLILNGNCKRQSTTKYRSIPRSPRPYAQYQDYYQDYYSHTQEPYEEITYCSLQFDSHIRSLTHLFVENNDIKNLSYPGDFITDTLPMLTHLSLSHNPVNVDQKALLGLGRYTPGLTHLYLQHCQIAGFNATVLQSVTSLYVDGNNIQSICGKNCEGGSLELNEARELKTLSVSHNRISNVDDHSFSDAQNLLTLDLSHNSISEIREGTFDRLFRLQSLSLESNKLVLLNAEDAFRDLIGLKVLYLGGNDLSGIGSSSFTNLTTLAQLGLNNTRISSIHSEMFSHLVNLEDLSLAGNQLTQIPRGSMPTSGSLVSLDLNNNKFTDTKDISLVNAPNLLSISLKDNPLITLSAQWLAGIKSENLTISLGHSLST